MDSKARIYYESPIGLLEITGDRSGIESVSFVDRRKGRTGRSGPQAEVPRMLKECASQLNEYFEGSRKTFDLRLAPSGTVFQKRVWKALLGISCGRTKSYGDIARTVGKPLATRAVGGANHRNPIVIIIPCHRVVGSDGRLTGYGGGLWRKEWLLAHEARPGRSPVGETRRGRTGRPRKPERRAANDRQGGGP